MSINVARVPEIVFYIRCNSYSIPRLGCPYVAIDTKGAFASKYSEIILLEWMNVLRFPCI